MKHTEQTLPSILVMNQELIGRAISKGSRVIDATAGNGHDTLFLAELVGDSGHVYAFDIQQEALAQTEQRLTQHRVAQRATLFHAGHDKMLQHIPGDSVGKIDAVLFNLGYLPRGNKQTITTAITTIPALEQAIHCLAPGGIIAVVAYVGHPGGQEEARAVLDWCKSLDPKHFQAFRYELLNMESRPPFLIVIEKRNRR